jgi:hypothetical protein
MKMNGAEEQSGLCEGEGKGKGGHFGELISWLRAGSGDYMRFTPGVSSRSSSGTSARISSGSPGSGRGEDRGVRGLNRAGSFSWLAALRLCSARPQDSSGSDPFVHPLPLPPLLSFLLPLSNYSLVSSPAGRSFFEKTTRARTRPTHSHKKYRSLPIPTGDTRPHSYVFSSRLVHTLDLHPQILFLTTYLQIPALIPCLCPIYYLFLSFPPILAYLSGFYLFHLS